MVPKHGIIFETIGRKIFGNLGVHKNEENHALPEPKNENRKSFGNLGVHKNEQNHALPEPKKLIEKNWKSGSA